MFSGNHLDLLQCGDVESNPGPKQGKSSATKASNAQKARSSLKSVRNSDCNIKFPFKIVRCWQASFHQGHVGDFYTTGRQCSCIATVALSVLPYKANFSHKDLNEILFEGDKLYE